jgi:hypothetical protein
MKIYCRDCKKPTQHRQKLGGTVCNKCDKINHLVYLERINDRRCNIGSTVFWIEFDDAGRGKAAHNDPQIGFSLCIDPYFIKNEISGIQPVTGFTWMTTLVTEIIEDIAKKEYRKILFRTQNSEYELHITKKQDD